MRGIKKGDRVRYKSPFYGTGVGSVVDVLEDHVAYGAPYSVLMDHALPGQPQRDYFELAELELVQKYSVTLVFGGGELEGMEPVTLVSDSVKGLRLELYKKTFEQLLDEDDRIMQQWRIENRIKRKD